MIIDGRQLARDVLAQIKSQVETRGRHFRLDAILIGNDPALRTFVELKEKSAVQAGIQAVSHYLSESASEGDVLNLISRLSENPEVHGIFIELPIPKKFNTQRLLEAIPANKDVDALNPGASILPPAVGALQIVFAAHRIDPQAKKVSVFGQGRLIGKPISDWLESQGAIVARIDERTEHPEKYSREADIVISGVGNPDLITADMIKDGAIVIDFGYGKKGDLPAQAGKMVGDVAFEEVSKKASLITPVPGGMGPLVIAAVLQNLVNL